MNHETLTPGTHKYHTPYDEGVAEGGYFTIDCTLCAGDGDWTEWDCQLASQRVSKPPFSKYFQRQGIPQATLRQKMKNGLRRRMEEPLEGTWGNFQYEENDEKQNEEHHAGYEVSQDPSKGAQHTTDVDELCPVCFHHHTPVHLGGHHLD